MGCMMLMSTDMGRLRNTNKKLYTVNLAFGYKFNISISFTVIANSLDGY